MTKPQSDPALLRQVLARHDHHPEVRLHNGAGWDKVPVAYALQIIGRGEYDWEGTSKRVRKIRVRELVPRQPWEECYRTTAAPALQPGLEWLMSIACGTPAQEAA